MRSCHHFADLDVWIAFAAAGACFAMTRTACTVFDHDGSISAARRFDASLEGDRPAICSTADCYKCAISVGDLVTWLGNSS